MFIIIYIVITLQSLLVESSHFYGGTVTWKPMNNTASGSTIAIMFTQSYQWRRSFSGAGCNQLTIINQSPLIPNTTGTLSCTTSSCGGYTAISINEYCTDFSALVDTSSGQISTIQNITAGSAFCVAYQGSAWVTIYATDCGGGRRRKRHSHGSQSSTTTPAGCLSSSAGWSVGTCIDLTLRPDGFINTPPVATVISPVKVPVNTLTNIQIPVIDADNDNLECRWAEDTTDLDECGDVCQTAPGSTLDGDNCILTFNSTGKSVGDYFAVTLMVEDFYNSTTDTAFSRVPIQFLIYIVGQTNCSLQPTISSTLPECSPIEVGSPFNFSLTIVQGCPGTTIVDVVTMPPQYMYKSNLTQNGTSNVWIVTETWTPVLSQLGSQVYCAVATDSANIQSDQYCTTFTVVPAGSDSLCPGETSTTSSTTTTTTVTTTTSTSTKTTSSSTSTRTTSSTTSTTSSSTSTSTTSTTTTSSSSTSTSTTSSTTTTTSSSTSTSTTSSTTTTATTSSTSTSTTSSTTTTTTSSTSTSSTTSTTTTTTSSTSTSTTTSTTTTTTSSTSTSTTTSTTTTTSTSTSTTTSTTTTSSTSTSTTTSTTASTSTSTSTTSVTTTTTTTVAKNTNQINIPLIVGLSLLFLLSLLALCCCLYWRLFGHAMQRRRQTENEENMNSKYLRFNENSSRNSNSLSSKYEKSNKINRIATFDPNDNILRRSQAITTNSFEYHTDQNLNPHGTIDKVKHRETSRSTLSTSNVRVNKVPRIRSSSQQNRDESRPVSTKNTTSASISKMKRSMTSTNPNQSNELKQNYDTNVTVTKIKRVDLPPQINNETEKFSSSNVRQNEALKSSYSTRHKTGELFPKCDSSESTDVGKIKRSSFLSDINHNRSTITKQPSVSITTPKIDLSSNFPRNRSHTNANSANVTVTKIVRKKTH